jgi:hypothetical protein
MTITLPEHSIVIEGRDLDGAARTAYEQQVAALLRMIHAQHTGRLVLHWIRRAGKGIWVLIAPYGPYWQKKYGNANALSHGDLRLETISGDWSFSLKLAMKLNFSPGVYTPLCAAGLSSCGPGMLPDEVLLHELVHMQRKVSGISKAVSLKGTSLNDFENEEEFFAIAVQNLYISESGRAAGAGPGQTRLRADHARGALSDDRSFAQFVNPDYIRLIAKYCKQHPKLSSGLAYSDAPFNPFRTYYNGE